jgi:hypothetical protein
VVLLVVNPVPTASNALVDPAKPVTSSVLLVKANVKAKTVNAVVTVAAVAVVVDPVVVVPALVAVSSTAAAVPAVATLRRRRSLARAHGATPSLLKRREPRSLSKRLLLLMASLHPRRTLLLPTLPLSPRLPRSLRKC